MLALLAAPASAMAERRTSTDAPDSPTNDPPPERARSRPPIAIVLAIAAIIIAIVVLHLTGVVGPGSH
jgi:hypothetical protein